MSTAQVQRIVLYGLQTVGGILLLICVGLSSWALVEVVSLKVASARLEARVEAVKEQTAADRKNRDDQIDEMRKWMSRVEKKLDDALKEHSP